ncbi:hypothetical protein [Neisseria bacilliformis]|uniref:hypothetical protein n=1 Tax=Neisseria bacilliformis TaxID=267212 RepID=UPI0028E5C44D|nr:hypothetical protein [Neisseria bacilliformis]
MKRPLFLIMLIAACRLAAQPDMPMLAITGHTAEPAALYSVSINNDVLAVYETAEPLSAAQAVRLNIAPENRPVRSVSLELLYRNRYITAQCAPAPAPAGKTLLIAFNGTEKPDCRWQD